MKRQKGSVVLTRLSSPADRRECERSGNGVAEILILAAIVFVALRVVCAAIPLERDEGEYAYFAQHVLEGQIPYRDMFNQKPPGVFLAYLLPVALGGTSVVAIRVALYLWTGVTAILLYLIADEQISRTAAACAVLWFVILTIEPTWHATAANSEQWMLGPMVGSVWCAQRAAHSGRRRWWFACGVLAMAACCFKQVALTNGVFLLGYMLVAWYTRRQLVSFRSAALDAAAATAGILMVAIFPVAYFAANGALPQFLDAVLWHNLHYVGQVPLKDGVAGLREELTRQAPSLWPVWVLAAAGVCRWRREQRPSTALIVGWLVASFAGVSLGLRFYPHYFLQLAPALALGAGVATAQVRGLLRRYGSRLGRAAATIVPVAVIAPTLVHHARFFFATTAVEKVQKLYPGNPFDISADVAQFVRSHTGKSDRVLIFGSEPQILFLAERLSATRYIIFYPLMTPGLEGEHRQHGAWDEVRKSDPRCVIMTELYSSLLEQDDSPQFLRQQVSTMLRDRYLLQGARIWRNGRPDLVLGPEVRPLLAELRRSAQPYHADMYVYLRR